MSAETLSFAARLENLAVIRDLVQEKAAALGVVSAVIPGVVLAVDEAVTNIIVHGYHGQPGTVEIEIGRERDALVIRLRDQAAFFDPTSVRPPDLNVPLEQRVLGGMGIHLMRQMVDEMSHGAMPQGGNELTLVKRLAWKERAMNVSTLVDKNGVAVIEVEGEIDTHTVGDLDKALNDALAQGHVRLALGFARLNYISSVGLRALLRARHKARELGGDVRLFNLSARVLKIFEIGGFDQLFRIASTRRQVMENW